MGFASPHQCRAIILLALFAGNDSDYCDAPRRDELRRRGGEAAPASSASFRRSAARSFARQSSLVCIGQPWDGWQTSVALLELGVVQPPPVAPEAVSFLHFLGPRRDITPTRPWLAGRFDHDRAKVGFTLSSALSSFV